MLDTKYIAWIIIGVVAIGFGVYLININNQPEETELESMPPEIPIEVTAVDKEGNPVATFSNKIGLLRSVLITPEGKIPDIYGLYFKVSITNTGELPFTAFLSKTIPQALSDAYAFVPVEGVYIKSGESVSWISNKVETTPFNGQTITFEIEVTERIECPVGFRCKLEDNREILSGETADVVKVGKITFTIDYDEASQGSAVEITGEPTLPTTTTMPPTTTTTIIPPTTTTTIAPTTTTTVTCTENLLVNYYTPLDTTYKCPSNGGCRWSGSCSPATIYKLAIGNTGTFGYGASKTFYCVYISTGNPSKTWYNVNIYGTTCV